MAREMYLRPMIRLLTDCPSQSWLVLCGGWPGNSQGSQARGGRVTDLVPVTIIVEIAVEDDVDRARKMEELQELVGGPAYVLRVEAREAT